MEKLRVGLVGCGRMGAFTREQLRNTIAPGWLPLSHAEAIKANNNVELVAIADINEDSLVEAKSKYNISKAYLDYRDMISDIRPDILSIATRTNGRCDIIEFASKNGVKGIHFEKPISTNMKECNRAVNALRENSVKISYGTTRRFMAIYRKAKELITSGEIGDVIEISVAMGKSPLLWGHPHSVDLLLFFSNSKTPKDINYVQANCTVENYSEKERLVDSDPIVEFAFIKFKNGINGLITSSGGMDTIISGTQGKIVIVADGTFIEVYKKSSARPYYQDYKKIESEASVSGTQQAFYELSNAVKNGSESPIGYNEVLLNQNILLAFVLSSLKSGEKTELSELKEDFTVSGRTGDLYP